MIDQQTAGGASAGHVDIDELADAAEGLVEPARAAEIEAHLTSCDACAETADALAGVQELLADSPSVSMPDDVFARLQQAVTQEQLERETEQRRRRQADGGPLSGPGSISTPASPYITDKGRPSVQGGGRFPKPHIAEHFTEMVHRPRGLRSKLAGGAIGAALIASFAGFGGYVVSASAGTDEPPADKPIVVNQDTLKSSASAEAEHGDLDAYRFTKAWQCARKVTDGKITGIRSTVMDGAPGYLVFLRTDGSRKAVFVSGCETGHPSAGPTVPLGDK